MVLRVALGWCLLARIAAGGLVSNALGSHMVLQRAPQQARIWGWSSAGTSVNVTFNGAQATTTADSVTGLWSYFLPATPAGGPFDIVIAGVNETVTITDVMFGDVYVCNGQSNMGIGMGFAVNYTKEIEDTVGLTDVRMFKVGQNADVVELPLDEFDSPAAVWARPTPTLIYGFSMVCWYFGTELYRSLGGTVPIGLLANPWATQIEAFLSPDAHALCPNPQPAYSNMPPGMNATHSQVYNVQVYPILRMTFRAMLFYKGEAEVGFDAYWECAVYNLILDYRSKFGHQFGFYYVQLHPWTTDLIEGRQLAFLRLRMGYGRQLSLPDVGWASNVDQGDPTSPQTPLHPRNKKEIGHRLQLVALRMSYGRDVQSQGPSAIGYTVQGITPSTVVKLSFSAASVGQGGLALRSAACPAGVSAQICAGFELRTSDDVWRPATAALGNDPHSVYLTASNPGSSGITDVRFGYGGWPLVPVFNGAGLPATPFWFNRSTVDPSAGILPAWGGVVTGTSPAASFGTGSTGPSAQLQLSSSSSFASDPERKAPSPETTETASEAQSALAASSADSSSGLSSLFATSPVASVASAVLALAVVAALLVLFAVRRRRRLRRRNSTELPHTADVPTSHQPPPLAISAGVSGQSSPSLSAQDSATPARQGGLSSSLKSVHVLRDSLRTFRMRSSGQHPAAGSATHPAPASES
eukprot:TRINITY_DN1518_c1_g1_i1.p1 TRINITY_DN1518_c1_g1~~TRINITY_DN1518_c1_g1_i1.p1  ORF type:complete len:697 (-),score=191.42 TRINITY_DN1518_c1_g1_i1:376-2466(-)